MLARDARSEETLGLWARRLAGERCVRDLLDDLDHGSHQVLPEMCPSPNESDPSDRDGSAERYHQTTLGSSRKIGDGEGRKERHATAALNEALECFEIVTLEAGDSGACVSIRARRATAPSAALLAQRDDLRPQAMPH